MSHRTDGLKSRQIHAIKENIYRIIQYWMCSTIWHIVRNPWLTMLRTTLPWWKEVWSDVIRGFPAIHMIIISFFSDHLSFSSNTNFILMINKYLLYCNAFSRYYWSNFNFNRKIDTKGHQKTDWQQTHENHDLCLISND